MGAHLTRQAIIKAGLVFGFAAGIVGSINAVSSAATVGEFGEAAISNVVLLSVIGLAIVSGVYATRSSKRAAAGLGVGLLVGVIASLIANTARVGYSIAFYDLVRQDPGELRDWAHRGSSSFVNYLVEDRIGGYIYGTIGLGLICGISGIVGGLIGRAWDRWFVH